MGRVRLFAVLAVLAASIPTAPVLAGGAGPLERLLRRIPADAGGMISLSDLAAARRQMAPLIAAVPPEQRGWMPFTAMSAPNGFDAQNLHLYKDGAVAELGFSVLEIGQMAGWGELPEAPVIATGVPWQADAIESALQARGFAAAERGGVTVWHRQDDFEMDFDQRETDPYSHRLGVSQRFAIDEDALIFARSWAMIETILARQSSLASNVDIAALLRAGYLLDGSGELIEAAIFAGQGPRVDAAAALLDFAVEGAEGSFEERLESIPGMNLPSLPPFAYYGLLAWQDGATLTGAVAIPYYSAQTATLARDRFKELLAVAVSAAASKPFDELLPRDRRFEVIETSHRAVLILAFRQTLELEDPPPFTAFLRHPQRRLMQMMLYRDLDLLIGKKE